MECINRSMEMNLMADAMIRKLEQSASPPPKGYITPPEFYETRAQRRARERAEKKAAKRAGKQKIEVA